MSDTTAELEEPLEYELDPTLQNELLEHPGKWVTMTRREIIALGDSASEVLERARSRGYERPILHRVPRPGERTYFL
jgi:hypothetical protein